MFNKYLFLFVISSALIVIDQYTKFMVTLHIPINYSIKVVEGFTMLVETNYQVTRIMRDGSAMIFSTGCYYDRIVENDNALKFSERLVVFDSRGIDTLLVIPL